MNEREEKIDEREEERKRYEERKRLEEEQQREYEKKREEEREEERRRYEEEINRQLEAEERRLRNMRRMQEEISNLNHSLSNCIAAVSSSIMSAGLHRKYIRMMENNHNTYVRSNQSVDSAIEESRSNIARLSEEKVIIEEKKQEENKVESPSTQTLQKL